MIVPVTEMEYQKGKPYFDEAKDFSFVSCDRDEEALAGMITKHGCQAVVLGVDRYTEKLYEALPQGGILLRFGVGIDGLNREMCKRNGLYAANTPGALDQSVAEHAVFLLGDLVRHISSLNASVKEHLWQPVGGNEMADLCLAVFGLGKIGAMVARIAHQAFGMRVIVCEVAAAEQTATRLGYASVAYMNADLGIERWSADPKEILPVADAVSIHLPVIPQTEGYFNREKFSHCKPGTLLINTARGKLVVEDDLAQALNAGIIGGAALDVFETEPYQPGKADLRDFTNVILTPHVASNTIAANRRMALKVIENLRYWRDGLVEEVSLVFR